MSRATFRAGSPAANTSSSSRHGSRSFVAIAVNRTALASTGANRSTFRTGLTIMIIAVVIAVGVMLFAAKPISDFVNRHPTVKMLAFAFLILVGVVLLVDSTHRHVPKGYIYFAMAFSLAVEMLNMRLRKKGKPVQLNEPHLVEKPAASA